MSPHVTKPVAAVAAELLAANFTLPVFAQEMSCDDATIGKIDADIAAMKYKTPPGARKTWQWFPS